MALMTGNRSTLLLRKRPLDLVVCIDRSESMGYGRRQSKLGVAKQLSTEVVRSLFPVDRVAVVTFDNVSEVILPLTPISQVETIEATIDKVSERGNTCLVRGIRASRDAFDLRSTRNKNIIVLSDGRTNLSFDGSGGFEGSTSLEKEVKEACIDFQSLGISPIAIAIGTDAFIMPLKVITDTAKGQLIPNTPVNVQGLFEAIRTSTGSLRLPITMPVVEKKGLEVHGIPSELPAGQPTWSLESHAEHVAIVSDGIASSYSTVEGAFVSNPSNQRFAKVALASVEDDTFEAYRKRRAKTTEKVRSGRAILLDKSYRLELELSDEERVDLKM